uniref:Uncharacterized protein n=1 Tax=Arundo donax TaxID=35708 RepID=A0A0A9FQN3_ARUDO
MIHSIYYQLFQNIPPCNNIPIMQLTPS